MWATPCGWPCRRERSYTFTSLICLVKYKWSSLFAQKQNEPWRTSVYVADESSEE